MKIVGQSAEFLAVLRKADQYSTTVGKSEELQLNARKFRG